MNTWQIDYDGTCREGWRLAVDPDNLDEGPVFHSDVLARSLLLTIDVVLQSPKQICCVTGIESLSTAQNTPYSRFLGHVGRPTVSNVFSCLFRIHGFDLCVGQASLGIRVRAVSADLTRAIKKIVKEGRELVGPVCSGNELDFSAVQLLRIIRVVVGDLSGRCRAGCSIVNMVGTVDVWWGTMAETYLSCRLWAQVF